MSCCCEIYRVKIRYNDVRAEDVWSKENEDVPDDETPPPPGPVETEKLVVIEASIVGGEELGEIAMRGVLGSVGPQSVWDRYEPVVLSIELIEECAILIHLPD